MIWGSAVSLVLSVCLVVILPVIGMVNAFGTLKASGAADPSELASDISSGIMIGMLALPFAFASLILFIVAIVRHRKFSNPTQAC